MPRINQISYFLIALPLFASCITRTIIAPAKEPAREQNHISYVGLGNQYAKDGLLREAVEAYKKALAREPNNLTASRNLGIVLLKAGDTQGAIIHLEKSLAEFDDNFETNFYLGEAYRTEDKYADAIFRYNKALKIQNDEPRALKSLAWSYFKIRFYSEAIATANKLQKQNPDDDQVPMILARIQLKLKRDNEALATLKKGMERAHKQSHPYYYSVIAEVLASQGKAEDAFEHWKKALKTQPMLAGALMGTGKLLLEQGRKKEAVDYLERAVRVKPKMYEGHYWLARGLEESNPERSLKYFNYFRKHAANDPEFVDLIQDSRKRAAAMASKPKLDIN